MAATPKPPGLRVGRSGVLWICSQHLNSSVCAPRAGFSLVMAPIWSVLVCEHMCEYPCQTGWSGVQGSLQGVQDRFHGVNKIAVELRVFKHQRRTFQGCRRVLLGAKRTVSWPMLSTAPNSTGRSASIYRVNCAAPDSAHAPVLGNQARGQPLLRESAASPSYRELVQLQQLSCLHIPAAEAQAPTSTCSKIWARRRRKACSKPVCTTRAVGFALPRSKSPHSVVGQTCSSVRCRNSVYPHWSYNLVGGLLH